MGYCKQTALPTTEPVLLADAHTFLRLPTSYTAEDTFISGLIQAAREQGEIITGRALAQRTFVQVMDGFPDKLYRYAIDGEVLFGIGMYGLPWSNMSPYQNRQVIKLSYPPVISVQNIQYVDLNGDVQTLNQDTDFILDRQTDSARLVPLPGTFWPLAMVTANALEINFTAGYDPSPTATDSHIVTAPNPPDQQTSSTIVSGVPQLIRLGILNLVAYWFQNRGVLGVPSEIHNLFQSMSVYEFSSPQ